jgi:hypothetical protein
MSTTKKNDGHLQARSSVWSSGAGRALIMEKAPAPYVIRPIASLDPRDPPASLLQAGTDEHVAIRRATSAALFHLLARLNNVA